MKLSWYRFKIDCHNFRMLYAIHVVTTKIRSAEYAKKEMKREPKYVSAKEGSSGGNEG